MGEKDKRNKRHGGPGREDKRSQGRVYTEEQKLKKYEKQRMRYQEEKITQVIIFLKLNL